MQSDRNHDPSISSHFHYVCFTVHILFYFLSLKVYRPIKLLNNVIVCTNKKDALNELILNGENHFPLIVLHIFF